MNKEAIDTATKAFKAFLVALAVCFEPDVEAAEEKPKRTRRPKKEADEEEEEEEEEPQPKKTRGKSKGKSKVIDMAALRAVARQILDAGHGDKLKEVLADEFSAKRVSDLEEDDFAEAHKSLTQILEDE